MNTLFSMLAQTAPPSTRPGWIEQLGNPFWLLIIVFVVMYFMMMSSKRKQERQREQMLGQLKKGDRIQTIGGILGTVVEARDNDVLVKVDESSNAKIRFTRSAIHRVLEEEK